MKPVPHSLYSPDIAPSDFHLFGDVKRSLAGLSFESAEQLPEAVQAVLEGTGSDFARCLY
jgi:ABC-type transporter Mla subunit MlaD